MRALLVPLAAALVAVTALTGPSAPTAAADADTHSYTALAGQARDLAQDQPAPADWGTLQADASGSSSPSAWPDQATGRQAWFGRPWHDTDANGCDTRNDVLQRDLTSTRLRHGSGCTVVSGTLEDPYTGETVQLRRGRDTSRAVQVDHVVPLGFAYAHGAWAWDADKRLALANDPLNLLAVSGSANASKSDSGPVTSPAGSGDSYDTAGGPGWVPPEEGYTCAYAARFTQVASAYGLGLGQEDSGWLASTLEECALAGAARTSTSLTEGWSAPQWVTRLPGRVRAWSEEHPVPTLVAVVALASLLAGSRRRGR